MELQIFENLVLNESYNLLRKAIGDTVKKDGIVYQIRGVSDDNVSLRPVGWDPAVHPDWTMESFMAALLAYEERNVVRRWAFSSQRRMMQELARETFGATLAEWQQDMHEKET